MGLLFLFKITPTQTTIVSETQIPTQSLGNLKTSETLNHMKWGVQSKYGNCCRLGRANGEGPKRNKPHHCRELKEGTGMRGASYLWSRGETQGQKQEVCLKVFIKSMYTPRSLFPSCPHTSTCNPHSPKAREQVFKCHRRGLRKAWNSVTGHSGRKRKARIWEQGDEVKACT